MRIFHEHYDLPIQESFFVVENVRESFHCHYHFHEEFELVAFRSGAGEILLDGQTGSFAPGDVFLIGADVPHAFVSEDQRGFSRKNCTSYICVGFRQTIFGSGFFQSPEFASIGALLRGMGRAVKLRGTGGSLVTRECALLVHEQPFERALRLLRILKLMEGFRPDFERPSGEAIQEPVNSAEADRMARVHRFIAENSANEKVKLADVARVAAMSPGSFSNWFTRKMGKTFKEHLIETRVFDACSRLLTTDDPITSLCYDCGFNTLANFNRQFKRIKHMTPTEFRSSALRPR